VPKAVCRSALAVAVDLEAELIEEGVEELALDLAEDEGVGGLFRSFRRSNGVTAPGMLLQYPTPRLPRTSISRMRSRVSSSLTIVTSRYCRRRPSSGLRPVLAMNNT
jgi:hypothetical protein